VTLNAGQRAQVIIFNKPEETEIVEIGRWIERMKKGTEQNYKNKEETERDLYEKGKRTGTDRKSRGE
jgi:hypothetical protein